MRKLHLATVVLLGATLSTFVLACGDDSTGPDSVKGTYTLRSINGQAPPVVEYETEFYKGEITSGSISLTSATACTFSIGFRETDKTTGEVVQDPDTSACTYSVSGTTITFDFGDGDVETATISGDTITTNDDGDIWVFRK